MLNTISLQQAQSHAAFFNAQQVDVPTVQAKAEQEITDMLAGAGFTFANITQVTQVACAAAHSHIQILKISNCNISIANSLKEFTSIYRNAVQRSAAKIAENDPQDVANYVVSDTYYFHTNCYSVVEHKTNGNKYLYAIYNKVLASVYYCASTNTILTPQQVANYLTPSAAKKMLSEGNVVHNITNDVYHDVVVRTVSLQNIVQLNACKQQYIA